MKRCPRRPNQRPVTSRRSAAVHPKRSTSNATAGAASAVDVGFRAIEGVRLPVQRPFSTRAGRSGDGQACLRATYHPPVEPLGASAHGREQWLAVPSRVLRPLQRVTDAALAHLADDELLAELLDRITEILHTDTAAFLLLDEPTAMLHARAAKGIEEEVEQGVRIPVGRGFAGRIAAERRPDLHRRRRPRRHPQPDPAREGHPLAARRPAARRRPRPRRPARRHAHPARVHRPTTASCSNSPPTAPRSPSSTPTCSSASARRAHAPSAPCSSRRCSGSPTPRSPTCRRRSC